MKKIISLLLALMLGLTVVGCSNEVANQKTVEELNTEVKSDIKEEQGQEQSTDKAASLDVRDNDAVYEFINATYNNYYSREDFDKWTAFYFDITEEGNDEVIFTTTYGDGKLENAIFITGDEGKYNIIPSNIGFAKYENNVAYEDGFILISQKGGGPGAFTTTMGVYIYDEKGIKYTWTDIVKEDVAAFPDGYLITGKIEGEISDFVYTQTKEDYATEKISVIEKTKYTYNQDSKMFDREVMDIGTSKDTGDNNTNNTSKDKNTSNTSKDNNTNNTSNDNNTNSTSKDNAANNKPKNNDYTKGIEHYTRNGNVYIKYKNTGNEVEVYNTKTTIIHQNLGEGISTFKSGDRKDGIARSTSLGNNGNRLYFNTNPQTGYSPNTEATFYVNLSILDVTFVAEGMFVQHITEYPYTNYAMIAIDVNGSTTYLIYDSNNQFACNLGGSRKDDIVAQIASAIEKENSDAGMNYKLSGFKAETINNEYIDYSKYMAVIVPMHNTINLSTLDRKTCSFSDNPSNIKMTFAIFGEMQDIKVTYLENMDSKGEVEDIGTLKNAYLDIYAPFGTDTSFVKVTGKIDRGEGYFTDVEFTLDDVRDIDTYAIYKYE